MPGRALALGSVGAVALLTWGSGCARGAGRDRPTDATPAARRDSAAGAVADVTGRTVRVALAVGVQRATVSAAGGGWRILDASGGRVIAEGRAGAAWAVERDGVRLRAVRAGTGEATPWLPGPLVVRPVGLGALLVHGGTRWRGELRVHAAAGGGVTVVNHLPVEEYLRGVVPLELSTTAAGDAAAVEAQAVAARSYTFSRLAEYLPREQAIARAHQPFDLRATVADQVYGGVDAERPAADRAIRATSGLVLRHEGAVVSAPYHSACGGSTAAPDEVWNGPGGGAYLRAVSDRIPGSDGRRYCDRAPRDRWTRAYDAPTLHAVLERYLRRYARESGGAAAGAGAVGAVRALGIVERTPSGRVGSLAVTTDRGRFVLRGNDIRFALRTLGGEILPSTYFSVDASAGGDGRLLHVSLRGQGNGHGIGMCQWGAMGRSRAGQDFRTILRTYYPGTTIEPAE